MRIFIAGIMQGSRQDDDICGQDYRHTVKQVILGKYPDAEIVCPFELYPDSPAYGAEDAMRTFLDLAERAKEADIVIAYLPEASMGTAIEMWQAYGAGARILSISPMSENWVVKFLSDEVFATMEEFSQFISDGGLERASAQS